MNVSIQEQSSHLYLILQSLTFTFL